ncbi:MAG: hypothetical protein SFY95_09785 [Planctomycetota bacterium]|nr:hypothetical protein [Planctomycetota bacterium]
MSNTPGGMEEQLVALYAEREMLASELGVADADEIIDMVRNLEAQLHSFYSVYGSSPGLDDPATAQLLAQVKEIDQTLADAFSEKTVTLEIENDRPVLRATWRQTTQNGDRQ